MLSSDCHDDYHGCDPCHEPYYDSCDPCDGPSRSVYIINQPTPPPQHYAYGAPQYGYAQPTPPPPPPQYGYAQPTPPPQAYVVQQPLQASVRTRPKWQPDASHCTMPHCKKPLGFLSRHHCRNCGASVCDTCSRNFLYLRHLGYGEKQRTCVRCVEVLNRPLVPPQQQQQQPTFQAPPPPYHDNGAAYYQQPSAPPM